MISAWESRLVQARGLKHGLDIGRGVDPGSRLVQARGLKPAFLFKEPTWLVSRLVQARGLKHQTET